MSDYFYESVFKIIHMYAPVVVIVILTLLFHKTEVNYNEYDMKNCQEPQRQTPNK